jgi:hypothetical protein
MGGFEELRDSRAIDDRAPRHEPIYGVFFFDHHAKLIPQLRDVVGYGLFVVADLCGQRRKGGSLHGGDRMSDGEQPSDVAFGKLHDRAEDVCPDGRSV